jgi:hypothetical protein
MASNGKKRASVSA